MAQIYIINMNCWFLEVRSNCAATQHYQEHAASKVATNASTTEPFPNTSPFTGNEISCSRDCCGGASLLGKINCACYQNTALCCNNRNTTHDSIPTDGFTSSFPSSPQDFNERVGCFICTELQFFSQALEVPKTTLHI